jgi:hypothetical protein
VLAAQRPIPNHSSNSGIYETRTISRNFKAVLAVVDIFTVRSCGVPVSVAEGGVNKQEERAGNPE